MRVTDDLEGKIRRGPVAWTFIYVALGFALSIEGTFLQMIEPLRFPWNLVAYVALMAVTIWLFTSNRWFHEKLVEIKDRMENKAR
jgi:cytochrome b subunit of formate dehydrogenase